MMQAEDETDEPISIKALIGQLTEDSRSFAKAEVAWFRAEAGERAHYAVPGLVAIGAATTLVLAAIIALIIGIMMLLSAVLNPIIAIFGVFAGCLLIAFIAIKFGTARLRGAFSPRDNR